MSAPVTDADVEEFRAEVRAWLAENVPAEPLPPWTERAGFDLHRAWEGRLFDGGYAAVDWPTEYGGRDAGLRRSMAFAEEYYRAGAPERINMGGLYLLGPVLMQYGTPEQCARWIPDLLACRTIWCQGFSEPGSGSDLASLRTRAERDGDHYVVNGQKIWTSMGGFADWIFALVRTDPEARKQAGISFLLIDMTTPGLEVRPIELIDGGHEVNEVWFTDVRVPAENLVGELNKGWDYAKFLLGNERVGVAPVGASKRVLESAKAWAREVGELQNPLVAARFAELENELLALELTAVRVAANSADGKPHPASSVLKLRGTELQQEVSELAMDLAGPAGLASFAPEGSSWADWARRSTPVYLNLRKASIYGGSNEIQRQIISRTILGL